MNKKKYFNTVTLQTESLFELAKIQISNCFSIGKLDSLMTCKEFGNLRRIVLSGCGDSYSAVGSMLPALKELSGLVLCEVIDPMELSRFTNKEDLLADCREEEVLVIAVSASGNSERILEILEKARNNGVRSMLISNNSDSKGAKAAETVFCVETPELCNTPGLRSYFASMIAVASLGTHIGVCNGHLQEEAYQLIAQAMQAYISSYQPVYERIDDQMFALSQTWRDFWRFDFIGDEAEEFTAQFTEEKMIECAGSLSSHTNTEDWCHVNYFLKEPETIGTVFFVNSEASDYDRALFSVRSAVGIGRPVLVVTDGKETDFPDQAVVCEVPETPAGMRFLAPLMDFIPGALLSSYCAALADKDFFAGRYNFREQKWNVDLTSL